MVRHRPTNIQEIFWCRPFPTVDASAEIRLTTWDAVSNPKTDVFHVKIVKDQLVQDFDIFLKSMNVGGRYIDACFRAVE